MAIKDALALARSELNAGLKAWDSPGAKLLPIGPAHAASCLRLALRHRRPELAYAATKTLSLFGEHLLWSSLLTFAAADTAVFGLEPTLAIMAAKRDRTWLRRKGGLSRVASYLVTMLLRAPRSMDATYLLRQSFEPPDLAPHEFAKLATDARSVRRGMLELLGQEQSEIEGASQVFNKLTQTSDEGLAVEIAIAAFRQTLAPPALMAPLIRMHFGAVIRRIPKSKGGTYIESFGTRSGTEFSLSATLTRDTPAGRKATRGIVRALPVLGREMKALGADDELAVEIVGELLERLDDGEDRKEVCLCSDLQATSRWSGVGDTDRNTAQKVGSILDTHKSLVTKIRLAHIPLSLLGFV